MLENIEILNEIIVGRVEPYIYAFSTNTIPNYLKVGDTYRPVSVRLNEWKKHFPSLQEEFTDKAMVNTDIFFRDYSVHQYLVNELSRVRLEKENVPNGTYYSDEFFKEATPSDVQEAISDIKESHNNDVQKYHYYNSGNLLPETYTYASSGMWPLRPNQEEVVCNFRTAVDNGRTNLLMYAVMRFGKSFTSLCCAKEMNAKIVLVVSAKADVREEWKKTVQSADNFNSDYIFLYSDDLSRDRQIVKNTVSGGKGVVVFLTLQDLQGDEIKDKHQEIFGNIIDLLIIDETHYGARAEKYGQVLKSFNYDKDVKDEYSCDDFIEIEDATEQLKELDARIRLHLSGTPYRILMGSEFAKDDIIAFCQFSDIVKAQEEWDNEYILHDQKKEWDNPYYGFPQMVRFAFNPSAAAMQKLQELKSNGITYAFSALFKPQSIRKPSDGKHKKFIFEEEVLNLFEVIDGSKEDENLLSFLDYDKIKDGKMCRHIVCVLPYRASCDALEELLTSNADKFKNLQNYTIINISGIDKPNTYKTVQSVKTKIEACEDEDKKTITLTVNRMLTGSTVEQWDTMLFFKDTASPQEYDQAVFRLQNQYVKVYADENGDIIKYNMKPQTLLVDFDPHRMFSMQEQKSLIYNANTDEGGNQRLQERMEEELRISPIITLNKNKIGQVQATDILSALSAYSKDRGIMDETQEIPIDLSLLNIDSIKREIEKQAELGSKQGLQLDAHEGDDSDLDLPDEPSTPGTDSDSGDTADTTDTMASDNNENDIEKLKNKFRMYYSRILFFSFLSSNTLKSLDDILECIEVEDNARIARNLALEKDVLSSIRQHINVFVLSQLDYKIQNINTLSHDENVEPLERAITAINKFGKLSESEITTPAKICDDMIALLPDACLLNITDANHVILDIASKAGEFPIAICKRCELLGIDIAKIKDSILAIPTSSVAYEFTRKIYELLGLDIDCIASEFTSYDLLTADIDYETISKILTQVTPFNTITLTDEISENEGEKMRFEAVVGNPPYQVSDGGAQASARPIYHQFVTAAKELSPEYMSFIIPTRWYSGGKGLDDFRDAMLNDVHIKELHDCLHPEEIFPDTNNRGGVCYFLWDKNYDNVVNLTKVVTHDSNDAIYAVKRSMKTRNFDIFIRNSQAIEILNKVIPDDNADVIMKHISPRKPFGIDGNFANSDKFHSSSDGLHSPVKCYGKAKSEGYIEIEEVKAHSEWIDKWKVYMPYANNIGTELNDDNQNTFVGEPNTVCTETFLVAGADLGLDETMSNNLSMYLRTKFARFLHSLAKISQHGTSKTYRFVPTQDFSKAWTDEELYAKYALSPDEIALIENSIKPMD